MLVFKYHIFSISISSSLYSLRFSKTTAEIFFTLCTISGQTFSFLSLIILSSWLSSIIRYELIEKSQIFSLNYIFRTMSIQVIDCFYPVVMTDIPMQILTYPLMKGFVPIVGEHLASSEEMIIFFSVYFREATFFIRIIMQYISLVVSRKQE